MTVALKPAVVGVWSTNRRKDMSLTSHLDHLRQKHQALEERIEDEQRRPGSDPLTIASLKRKKLLLKDEITRLAPEYH
jgi:hypothetical protein